MTFSRLVSCGLAAGITMFLVGTVSYFLTPVIRPGIPPQYEDVAVFRVWSGWTSQYMIIHPFAYGLIFSAVFIGLRRMTDFPSGIRGGLLYGVAVFLVGSLPVFLLVFASLQLSREIIVSWMIQNLSQYSFAGMAVGAVADGMTVQIRSRLPAPAERVWELIQRKETFLEITRGMVGYPGAEEWPDKLFSPGTILTMLVRPFGWGPASPHEVRVVRVDETAREIETEEHGGLVSLWNHRMHVESVSSVESRYTDCVELKAGLLTPVAWAFASLFYLNRQRRWRKLLAEQIAN